MKNSNILSPFEILALQSPNKLAMVIDGREYFYGEVLDKVRLIAGWMKSNISEDVNRVGILASRDFLGYVSIYAAIWSGITFVPLNPKFPVSRIKNIIERSKLGAIVYDRKNVDILDNVLSELSESEKSLPLLLLNTALSAELDEKPVLKYPANVDDSEGAYLMYTSGTTGKPKGILATVGNLKHYLSFKQERYKICSSDRLSQVFELSFDASIFDLLMSIKHGASLFTVPESQLLAPGRFIKESQLTLWFGVPSHIAFMDKMHLLVPDCFPDLRISIFGGEPLPVTSMRVWRLAAPNSRMDNVYGPTEATVTCFVQECNESTPVTDSRGVMSIGMPSEGNFGAIIGSSDEFLTPGEAGELVIAGPQVTEGYWLDKNLTELRFRYLDHPSLGKQRWYFTGDWAFEDKNGVFHHLGRMDNQIKLSGHRVELEEIETTLREVSGSNAVAAVPWPYEQGTARGIVAFICKPGKTINEMRENIKQILPAYMIPRRFVIIDALPYTLNGKVDRKLLIEQLDSE